jgi:hypothetical protein
MAGSLRGAVSGKLTGRPSGPALSSYFRAAYARDVRGFKTKKKNEEEEDEEENEEEDD